MNCTAVSASAAPYGSELTEDERNALRQAISPAFLSQENWVLDKSDDIRTARSGARVLTREYVNAIRRVLGEAAGAGHWIEPNKGLNSSSTGPSR
jgi:hypothetical protein